MYRVIIASLLIGLGFLPSLAAKEPEWRKLRSEHFELYTQDSERKGRMVLEHLERVRAAYEFLTKHKIQRKERGRVVLFRNEREYRDYSPGQFSAAFYTQSRGLDYVLLSDYTTDVQRVLNHEYFHLFSRHAEFRLPLWLEEGLADFYSTLQITKKEVHVGLAVPEHLRYLNSMEGSPVPLSRIFAVDRENRFGGDRRDSMQLYAQGWALAHMTFLGGNMMSRSDEFFREVIGRENAMDAYEKVYGASTADLDQLLRNYIRQASYQYLKAPVEGLDFKAPVEAAPVEAWEGPLILADLQAYTRRTDLAAQSYESLAKQFPDVAEIHESRGYLARMEMDKDKAVEHYRAAAEKGSRNSAVYYELAAMGCSMSVHDENCVKWINESLRLDQTNRAARKWATLYALNNRQFEQAVIYMVRGGPVSASDAPEFFTQYAYAQANLGKFDDARTAIRRGLEYARKPEETEKLKAMERMVDGAAAYREQVAQLQISETQAEQTQAGPPQTGTVARTSVARLPDPDAPPRNREERDTVSRSAEEARRVALIREAAHNYAASADAHFENFLALENTAMLAAVLRRMDCTDGAPRLEVEAKGRSHLLAIDDPGRIRVFQGGKHTEDYEFRCGAQKGERIVVGYETEGAPEGTEGVLRILSFP